MSSRFGHSNLNRDAARSSLFSGYDANRRTARPAAPSPSRPAGGGYGYAAGANGGPAGADGSFRPATPNKKGQYSDAVLSELESQNDEQVEGMSARVRALKDITVAIGDEIRSSSAFADSMNDSFDRTRVRLRGTMNRMLRMAERTGVGWRVWLGFFAAVVLLFWYVWLS